MLPIDQRHLLLCLLLLFSLSGCSNEQPQVHQWNLQSHAVEGSVDYQELVKFAANVKVMSGGRLSITPHPAGSLTEGPDIFRAVSEGRIEMGNGWPNWWSGQHPAWAVMNAGPFDFMNIDASMMFFYSDQGTLLANELAKPKGIIWRPAWWPGMEMGLLSKEPVTGLADLAGKRIRIGPGLPSEALSAAANAYSIPLVPKEIRPALESGDLDAVEWTTTGGALDLKLQDVANNAIVPAIWQPSVLSDFLINESAYDALPKDLQAILETAIKSFTLTTTMKAKVADFAALKTLKAQGMKFNTWSENDIATWRTASDQIINEYKNKDEFTRRLINKKHAFKATYNEYYELFGPYE